MEDLPKFIANQRVHRANPPASGAGRSESVPPETPLEVIREQASRLRTSRSRVMRELKSPIDIPLRRASAPAAANVAITAHAFAVFGDRERAMDWLRTPNHLFGGESPEEYARSGGLEEVEKILVRIEYGVFS